MLKIKDDVPLINLIDMGFTCHLIDKGTGTCTYSRWFNNSTFIILYSTDRIIIGYLKGLSKTTDIKMYDHCIRDLVQKGYVEEVK